MINEEYILRRIMSHSKDEKLPSIYIFPNPVKGKDNIVVELKDLIAVITSSIKNAS